MSRQIQIRRGTATEHETFIGAMGEITMDTTNKTLRLHDGVTPGGIMLATRNNISATGNRYVMLVPDYNNSYDVSETSFKASELCFVVCDAQNSPITINEKNMSHAKDTTNIQTILSPGDVISGYTSPLRIFPMKQIMQ